MLDSSPIRGPVSISAMAQPPPPPPKKLKRSASVASLPSPPPSVQPPRKRAARLVLKPRKGSYAGDSDAEDDEEVKDGDVIFEEEDEEDNEMTIVGRKILFPTASSMKLRDEPEALESMEEGDDDDDDPFVVRNSSSPSSRVQTKVPAASVGLGSPTRRSSRLQAAANIAPVTSTPVKSPSKKSLQRSSSHSPTRRSTRISAKTANKDENKGKCRARELPIVDDAEDNPFFVKMPPQKLSRGRERKVLEGTVKTGEKEDTINGRLGRDEKPTVVYVFKGVKTSLPNPYYNLPSSAYAKAKLPLDHPDYEPLPAGPSQLKLKPKKRNTKKNKDQGLNWTLGSGGREDRGEGSSNHSDMSSDEEEDDGDDDTEGDANVDHPSSQVDDDKDPSPPLPVPEEPRTPENKPRVKYSAVFRSESGKPILDSGPEGVRGAVMDPDEIGRMAVGPVRGEGGGGGRNWQSVASAGSDI